MRALLFRCQLSPGDIVMLTAAIRDLHRCHPGEFVTDVRTSCMDLWEHNPYLTPLDEADPEVEVFDCHYPLVNESNEAPYHFVHGFSQYLNEQLGLAISPTAFHGDVHLAPAERSWASQVAEVTGEDLPFWIIVAGGKYDYTVKWWDARRWQEVVHAFRDRAFFVQVGESEHHHPALEGVLDLRGQTSLRQLVRLVHHAAGVLCPVTSLMHLAAAVETRADRPPLRPCVVVAGGREPAHWEAYPGHQFIHTIGCLPCCTPGGCWKSRTEALGDGAPQDRPEDLCVDVVNHLPRCMDLIPSAEVVRRVELYFDGGAAAYLDARQADLVRQCIARSRHTA